MVMASESRSLRGPPAPVLPKSLLCTEITAAPLKLVVGAKAMPSSAVLTLTSEPVKVIDAEALAPAVNVKPETPDSVRAPLVANSVISMLAAPASTSETETRLPLAVDRTSGVL